MSEIPVVDLHDTEEAIVERLREACLGYGFFYLKGHGISQDQMDLVLSSAKDFFSQSDDVKGKVGPGTPGPEFRGYSPWRAIALDPKWQKGGDTREQFTIGREVAVQSDESRKWPSVLGPNKWPVSSEGFDGEKFEQTMRKYYADVESLGMKMLPYLSKSLGAEEEEFAPLFSPALVTMNLNHYAATPSDPAAGILGCGAHTDYGVLTFLLTDEVPGLEDPQGLAWLPVPPKRGLFVVNTGDMLERLSNGRFRSNLHRVVVGAASPERQSVAVFFEPAPDAVVSPLPCCCSDGDQSRFPPVVSGQFLLHKYAATGEGSAGAGGTGTVA